MITYVKALETVFNHLPLPEEKVTRLNKAEGFFLAEDVLSDTDLPMFDNSAMDGYAVSSHDTGTAAEATPVILQIIGDVPAGRPCKENLNSGQALYIATGGMIPKGADAVVPVEDTIKIASNKVKILKVVRKHDHIRFAGEDIKKGDTILTKHAKLGPAQIGMLAAIGKNSLKLFLKPEVAFLATGDELIEPEGIPEPGQVRNTNALVIGSMVKQSGFRFKNLGIVGDQPDAITNTLKNISLPDVLITSAGVSVGRYDIVAETLKSIGLKIIFWKVAIKPGKPLVFGRIGKTLYFGLPGNPVSAAVVYRQIVEPALLAMAGSQEPFPIIFSAESQSDIMPIAGRIQFVRGICFYDCGWRVRITGKQSSHMYSSMSQANCLIVIPSDKRVEAGDSVKVQMFNGLRDTYHETIRAFSELLT